MTSPHLYNQQPDYWREITEHEFARIFFQYILERPESKQIFYNSNGEPVKAIQQVRLFNIAYDGWEDLGVAIAYVDNGARYNKEWSIKYFKYGHPKKWESNERKFAAQFAGDNS